MHPVSDHEVFVRVADKKGFTAAGRELRMSTAVVSSRIAKLEERIGHKLFVRNTRDIGLTEEGKIYYDHCVNLIAEEAQLEHRFQQLKKHPSGALRVSAPTTLGRTFIAPLCPKFQLDNPDVQIRLQLTDRLANIIEEDIDVAVRMGETDSSILITTRLAPDTQIVCAAPSYFDKHGVPATPDALRNHNCLLLRFPGSRRYYWQFQTDHGQTKKFMLAGDIDADVMTTLIDWAVEGHGLVMASIWDLHPYIDAKKLQPVLLDFQIPSQSIKAIMPPRKPQPMKTRHFIDCLQEAFKESPAFEFAATPAKLNDFAAS